MRKIGEKEEGLTAETVESGSDSRTPVKVLRTLFYCMGACGVKISTPNTHRVE